MYLESQKKVMVEPGDIRPAEFIVCLLACGGEASTWKAAEGWDAWETS